MALNKNSLAQRPETNEAARSHTIDGGSEFHLLQIVSIKENR